MQGHLLYMRRALELAQMAKGYTTPNPMVGAVLVYGGRIIGEGWHERYGGPHAEVHCIESVREENKGFIPESIMYVSLEPCAHHGKTPPCALRLVQEKVKQVIVCNKDPFELVAGRGMQILQDNGIATEAGILENEGLWLNRRFFSFHSKRRPYVILKWAQTEQGFFAPVNRSRFQMSNKHSQQLVHKWRTEEAAIMVGHQTAITDDPQLTARLWPGQQPLRIVLDKKLALPHSLRLFNVEAETWVINEQKEEVKDNTRFVQLDFDELLLTRILEQLFAAGKLSLIVEGGASLLQSFIDNNLWDEARVFNTPDLLSEGIEAPTLKHAVAAMRTELDTDTLNVYTHSGNGYTYIPGMEL